MNNEVILQRKQPVDFIINYPYGEHGNKEYRFMGTKNNKIFERPIPMEVFDWLVQNTTTISHGELIIKPTENEDINYVRESIEDIEAIEKSVHTFDEIKAILEDGNHNKLKKALNDLLKDVPEKMQREVKNNVVNIAAEVGIDSSAKRKVICEWAGRDADFGDVLFEKE